MLPFPNGFKEMVIPEHNEQHLAGVDTVTIIIIMAVIIYCTSPKIPRPNGYTRRVYATVCGSGPVLNVVALTGARTDVTSEKESGLDKDDERLLKELVYYHGFLPREDLPFLLHYVGEFLVRLSEVDPDAQHQQRKREIILSVVCEGPPESRQTSEAMRRYEEQEEERQGRKKYEKRRGKSTPARRLGELTAYKCASEQNTKVLEEDVLHMLQLERFTHDRVIALRTRSHVQPCQLIKNIIIRRMLGKYMIETTHLFDSLSDVFEYYSQKPGFLMKTMFMLLYPIRQQSWEYYHSDLQLGKILGEGAYGLVREGTLRTKSGKTVPVAIKQTKSHVDLDKAKIKEMMKEARLMRLFRHKNIVRIYGVAVDEQPLLIILELVTGGALNSFLKDLGERIDTKEKISMCIGAGSGVEYLHSNECMHRDLAARNCLITKDRVVCGCAEVEEVKISDFGLSRVGTQYVLKTAMKLPIKWLAPETISTFTFSLKTDVFSFGVLAYEIFANGGEPWDGLSNAEVKALVLDGKSLKFPPSCPERLRDFFTHCVFAKNPAQRATMAEVVKTLKGFCAYSSLDSSGTPRRRSFLY